VRKTTFIEVFRRVLGSRALTGGSTALAALVGLGGCADDGADAPDYRAQIRRTSFGIPHIQAEDMGSLGFGMGYAFAEDHGCTLMDQIVKVRSQRSRYFGPGDQDQHLDSDFAYLHLGIYAAAERDFDEQPEELQRMIRGYAAGFNAHFAAEDFDGYCAGEDWVSEIDEVDLFAYYLDLGLLASARQLLTYIATASPPNAPSVAEPPPLPDLGELRTALGSNGWGLGAQMTESGRGMVLGNPHFPWEGELRLWESHLTIPGEIDVYGVGLLGVPGVLIGFTEAMAWTHTVSAGHRMTAYELELDPNDPTAYLYDGMSRPMMSETYTIEVRRDGGGVREQTRTLWKSHYGPMLNLPFGWTTDTAFTYRDANLGNRSLISQFLGMDRAKSLEEFQEVHRTEAGIPWVNTMSASADGRAWYMDSTPAPNLSDEAQQMWLDDLEGSFYVQALWDSGLVLLDGSTSVTEWVEQDGAREPGLVPYDDMPKLERDDFIFNANDSHWMTNPAAPLEGYSVMHGFERTPRSPRTRMNAMELTAGENGFAGADGKFSLEELQAAALSNRASTAELLLDAVVAECDGETVVSVFYDDQTQMVDISEACGVLGGWDARFDVNSVGAAVWAEFVGGFNGSQLSDAGALFDEPFDPEDPVATPRGLAPQDPMSSAVLTGLGEAVLRLEAAGVALDAPLGEVQFTRKGDEKIPIHGGQGTAGIMNYVGYANSSATLEGAMERGDVVNGRTDLSTQGYVVNYGTSFIMTMEFTEEGPRAQAFLTYSQSGETNSEHYTDQTRRFSEKQWRDCLFTDEAIEADPELTSYVVTGDAPAAEQ